MASAWRSIDPHRPELPLSRQPLQVRRVSETFLPDPGKHANPIMSSTFEQPSSASESSDTTSPKSTFRLASAPPRVQSSAQHSPIKRKPLPPGVIPVNLSLRSSLSSLKSPPYDSHPAIADSFLDEPIRAPILFDRSRGQDSPTLPPPGGFIDVENPDRCGMT